MTIIMKKKLIVIGAVAVAVLAAGAVWYGMWRANNGTGSEGSNQTTGQQIEKAAKDTDTSVFPAVSITNEPYEITGTMTGARDTKHAYTMAHDGEGNSMFSGDWGEGRFTFYTFGNETISCTDQRGCQRFPVASEGTPAPEVTEFMYDDAMITAMRKDAKYLGNMPCGTESCRTWEVVKDDTRRVFSFSSNSRFKRIETAKDGKFFSDANFTYKPVTIRRPENVTDFPGI